MSARDVLRWLRLRWRGLFARRRQEAELAREMEFHLDMLVAENVAAGMPPEEARLAAQREFGGDAQYREDCRDTWRPAVVSGVVGDLAYAARSLRRSPGFTAIAVFTLALGIGVNSTVFAFVRDMILSPLLRDHNLNLVALYNDRAGAETHFRYFSYPELRALSESTEVFSGVAALSLHAAALGPERDLQRRFVAFASADYFALQAITPWRGRFFTADESRPGAGLPVLVANHALWERLGRPENFVGSTLHVDGSPHTVIGVTPPGFVGLHVSIGPDAWLPLGTFGALTGADLFEPTQTHLTVFAKLRPQLTRETAATRLDAANRRLNALPPVDSRGPRELILDQPPRSDIGNAAPETVDGMSLAVYAALALGLSFLVLLVACLNLANMLLARGVARQKEIAVRLALGASRWRVVRGLLCEGLVLALLGGALSLALSGWFSNLLLYWAADAFAVGKFVLRITPYLDGPMLVATVAFSLVAPLLFSLWPALRITRPDLYPDLKQVAGSAPGGLRAGRLLSVADVPLLAQIALSLTLLFSAALFLRSATNARTFDLGFQPGGQLAAQLDYKLAKIDSAQIPPRQRALLAATGALPGVSAAAFASNIPYNFELPHRPVLARDGAASDSNPLKARRWAGYTAVTRGYFELFGIRLLRGRDFSPEESDGSSTRQVAIIDETLANELFGDADSLGRRVIFDPNARGEGRELEVVGVIRSPRNDVFANPPRRIYRPLGQAPESVVYLHVQVPEPVAFLETLRSHLAATAQETPVLSLRPFTEVVDKNINVWTVRAAAVLFGVFGGIALVLAAVGVYGVKAHATARRTREIGVRLALGACPRHVMLLILKQGAVQAALGLALGGAVALAVGRGLSAMLYKVDAFDLTALAGCAILLGLVLLLACWLPARRAMKVDPLVAIRTE